jgi:hypothetical protein
MPDEINVALIAAGVSVAALIWNLATVRVSRSLVLSAEEAAKRSELVRIHALEAVEELLVSVSPMIASVGALLFLEKHGIALDINRSEVQEQIKTIGENRAKIFRLRITSSPYLTEELLNVVDDILARTETVKFDELIGVLLRPQYTINS